MKKLLILLTILLILPIATAISEEDMAQIEDFKELEGEKLTGLANAMFHDERINLYITNDQDTVLTLHVITEKGEVTKFDQGTATEPTISVYTSKETINNIQNSESPLDALQEALKNEDISYETDKFGKKLKLKAITMTSKFFSFFT